MGLWRTLLGGLGGVALTDARRSTVLVTGHDGYIGSVLVDKLVRRGYRVRGLDTYYFDNAPLVQVAAPHELRRKDIRSTCQADVDGVDAVVHLAALSNDAVGELDPSLTTEINARASLRLARLAKRAGVARFVCASSCSIYGVDTGTTANEGSPLRPQTPYARSKVQMEQAIFSLADDRFAPVFLRNGTAYGFSPKQRFDLVLNNLLGWAMATGTIRILSDGTPWRPMVHVEDIADAVVAVLEAPVELVGNRAINIGDQLANHRISEIAEIVQQTVPGTEISMAHASGADSRSYRVDFSLLHQLLPAFRPKWTIESGTAALYDKLREIGFDPGRFLDRSFVRFQQLKLLIDERALDHSLRWTCGSGDNRKRERDPVDEGDLTSNGRG
jgi:nucleoside-diphosphate-sugar epimerase